MSEPLRVALPLGIGDVHWACQKLRALGEYHGRPIEAHVSSSRWHESVHYLEMVPFIAEAVQNDRAPFSLYYDMDKYQDEKWSTLEGCAGWRGFDYVGVPNGHLECGKRIESWWPELTTDYTYELNIPPEERSRAERLVPPGSVLLYLSGIGPNIGFHLNRFTPWHWCDVILRLNALGIEPYIIGADTDSDREYAAVVLKIGEGHLKVHNVVGQTSIPAVCAVIQRAAVWIGLNSGTGIVSAMQGTPTVMFWSDHRYRIGPAALHANMQRSWLRPEQLERYRTLSLGSPELTSEAVVKAAMEVMT